MTNFRLSIFTRNSNKAVIISESLNKIIYSRVYDSKLNMPHIYIYIYIYIYICVTYNAKQNVQKICWLN